MDSLSEARQIAARCWCDPETSGITMDPRLAEAFAKRLAPLLAERVEGGGMSDKRVNDDIVAGVPGTGPWLRSDGQAAELDALRAEVARLEAQITSMLDEFVRAGGLMPLPAMKLRDECEGLRARVTELESEATKLRVAIEAAPRVSDTKDFLGYWDWYHITRAKALSRE